MMTWPWEVPVVVAGTNVSRSGSGDGVSSRGQVIASAGSFQAKLTVDDGGFGGVFSTEVGTMGEIVVLRPEITIDHNAGWNWLQRKIYQVTQWEPRVLVGFSVVLIFGSFT